MSKAIYERAIAAKKLVAELSENETWNVGKDNSEELLEKVEPLSYDERCVIAAGCFSQWRGNWQFKMPSTGDVISQMKKRDDNGDNDFAIVHIRYSISKAVTNHE